MSTDLLARLRNSDFKLALFDLDGTLVDSVPDLADAVDYSMQQLDLPPPGQDRVRLWVGNGTPMLVRRTLAFTLDLPSTDVVSNALLEQALVHFSEHYQRHHATRTGLYTGARELLQHWFRQGTQLALVTNKPARFTQPLCEALDIARFFAIMISGDTLSVRKPDPGPLVHACDTLGINRQDTIMIGDSVHDLHAARAAAITAVCVSYGYNHGENISDASPDLLVDSLSELL